MKIRSNFISNSSSSSFILNSNTITVKEVAKIMLEEIYENYIEDFYDDEDVKMREEFFDSHQKLLKNLDNVGENQSLFFPTPNYDTWIAKIADNIIVCTCNNINWNFRSEKFHRCSLTKKTQEELLKIVKGNKDKERTLNNLFDDPYTFYGLYRVLEDFYSLPYEIIGTEVPNYDSCKKHGHWLWQTSKGVVCPVCISERREKLRKIEKND